MTSALGGIRVLDLSRVLAGPYCTMTLADLGAEVWKIEHPGDGDDTRAWRPPEVAGESTYFLSINRTKKSVAIDLKTPAGLRLLHALAAHADVLIANFLPDTLPRFGLAYEQLAAAHPRLVHCTITGYGMTGSRANDAGYDFVIQGESGLMAITGVPDGEPVKFGVAIADVLTGMNATQAILAALLSRASTGRGQSIDIALLDSALAVLINVGSGVLNAGSGDGRYGNAHASVVPYQTFATADGAIVLACGNDRQFRALCTSVLERPGARLRRTLRDEPRARRASRRTHPAARRDHRDADHRAAAGAVADRRPSRPARFAPSPRRWRCRTCASAG